jgi:hypothetical protein
MPYENPVPDLGLPTTLREPPSLSDYLVPGGCH